MHLRLDDVNAAGAGVAAGLGAAQVVQRGQGGGEGVQEAFGDLAALGVHNRIRGHQMADVAHQHQAAPRQAEELAIRADILTVRVEAADEGAPVLLQSRLQVALHQAQPVAVNEAFVLGVNGRHGVLAVLNGGDGGLQHDVLDSGGMGGSHRMGRIDLNFDVQPVVAQQHGAGRGRLPRMAAELRRGRQPGVAAIRKHRPQLIALGAGADGVQGHLLVASAVQRHGLIQKRRRPFDDDFPPRRVVAVALLPARRLRQHVGAVQGVVEAAPAGIGGVERIAGVHHRHH